MVNPQSKYILGERIAQGGMAEIYLGKIVGAEGFTRICAFKKVLPQFAEDLEFLTMFKQEAMIAKQLQNKNIVQVMDFECDGPIGTMIVMEYVDGQDLRSVLQMTGKNNLRIPTELAVYICSEVLLGLSYAHSAIDLSGKSLGIIHRDVSPQNVLVSYDGDVKITDFGIAKVQSASSHTRAGVIKGKFRYMSPEQASGYPVDARTDVFAMGIILWEMLTLSRLFKGEDDAQVLQQVRECKIKSPNEIKNTNIPAELESIIFKFLQKDAKQRFQTAREAAKELTRFLYSYKPNFFGTELSDFMQKIFNSKMESTRERMRSTLALPIDNMRQTGFSSGISGGNTFPDPFNTNDKENNKNSDDISQNKSSNSAFLGQANYNRSNDNAKIAIKEQAQANIELLTPKNNSNTNTNSVNNSTQIRVNNSYSRATIIKNQTHFGNTQKITQTNKPSILTEQTYIIMIVIFVVLALFIMISIKKKIISLPTELEILSANASTNKVFIEIDKILVGNSMQALPFKYTLETGKHEIIISRVGMISKKIDVDAKWYGSKIKEVYAFQRDEKIKVGNLQIVTNPDKANINIENGLFQGISGNTFSNVPVGVSLKLKIKHKRCLIYEENFVMPTGFDNQIFKKVLNIKDCK